MRQAMFLCLILAGALLWAGCGGGEDNPFELKSEGVTSAQRAVALAFAPDGRLFFAEQYTGDIRIVGADGELLSEPFAHLDVANWLDLDWGLTGLALDPDFASNGYVYAFYTEPLPSDVNQPIARPKIVRFKDQNNKGEGPTVLVGDFPETLLDHQGFKANGALQFGPDGFLYATMGDYDYGKRAGDNGTPPAQDPGSPLGKVLRLNPDGSAAPGNPFAGTPGADPRVYALGFSRGANLVFNPATGDLYTVDGTDSCEELDLVKPGANYGWPNVGEFPFSDCFFGDQERAVHILARPGTQAGQFLSFVSAWGMEFVSGAKYSTLGDSLLVCERQTKEARRLVFSGAQVTSDDAVVKDCSLDVTVNRDGTIYYSNETDIKRLVPEPQ